MVVAAAADPLFFCCKAVCDLQYSAKNIKVRWFAVCFRSNTFITDDVYHSCSFVNEPQAQHCLYHDNSVVLIGVEQVVEIKMSNWLWVVGF